MKCKRTRRGRAGQLYLFAGLQAQCLEQKATRTAKLARDAEVLTPALVRGRAGSEAAESRAAVLERPGWEEDELFAALQAEPGLVPHGAGPTARASFTGNLGLAFLLASVLALACVAA